MAEGPAVLVRRPREVMVSLLRALLLAVCTSMNGRFVTVVCVCVCVVCVHEVSVGTLARSNHSPLLPPATSRLADTEASCMHLGNASAFTLAARVFYSSVVTYVSTGCVR
jgi:hypothetical protein